MEQDYLARIRAQFPALAFSRSRLVTTGWDNDVVILDEALVFRFPKRESYGARFKAEVRLLRYLAPRMPVAVPEYSWLAPDESFGGYMMLHGKEMQPSVFRDLDPGARSAIATQLGEFFSVMHATPVDVARRCGFSEEPDGYWWNPAHAERTLEGLRTHVFGDLRADECEWIEHQFARYLGLSFDGGISVIHSDMAAGHILVDRDAGRITGVIDFADTEFSDPALDFAALWYYGEPFVRQVIAHYRGRMDDDFLDRSKFPALVHMAGNMLELVRGEDIPLTFESCREELAGVMQSGLTL